MRIRVRGEDDTLSPLNINRFQEQDIVGQKTLDIINKQAEDAAVTQFQF